MKLKINNCFFLNLLFISVCILGNSFTNLFSFSASEDLNSFEKCLAHEEVTAVVAVLGTAVFALLVACFLLSCITLKRKAKTTDYKTMPLPKQEHFRIPRAHINDSFSLGDI
jgi:hypothetical protein